MFKIFKYKIDERGEAEIPVNGKILRVDFVDDGFYNGWFLWMIVDAEEKETRKYIWDGSTYSAAQVIHPTTNINNMIKIIDIDRLSVDEIESILNKNEDWELVSFGSNRSYSKGYGWGVPPREIFNNFMAVKPIVDYPKDFKE